MIRTYVSLRFYNTLRALALFVRCACFCDAKSGTSSHIEHGELAPKDGLPLDHRMLDVWKSLRIGRCSVKNNLVFFFFFWFLRGEKMFMLLPFLISKLHRDV